MKIRKWVHRNGVFHKNAYGRHRSCYLPSFSPDTAECISSPKRIVQQFLQLVNALPTGRCIHWPARGTRRIACKPQRAAETKIPGSGVSRSLPVPSASYGCSQLSSQWATCCMLPQRRPDAPWHCSDVSGLVRGLLNAVAIVQRLVVISREMRQFHR